MENATSHRNDVMRAWLQARDAELRDRLRRAARARAGFVHECTRDRALDELYFIGYALRRLKTSRFV